MFRNQKFGFKKLAALLSPSKQNATLRNEKAGAPVQPARPKTASPPVKSEKPKAPVASQKPATAPQPSSTATVTTIQPSKGFGIKKFFSSVTAGAKKLWGEPEKNEFAVAAPDAPAKPSAKPAYSSPAKPVKPAKPIAVVPDEAIATAAVASQPTESMPSKITLPLPPIVETLPEQFKALSKCKGSETVTLDALPILNQLASGTVKIHFGELRNNAGANCFFSNPQYDNELVEIPLEHLVEKLGQYLPTRRPGKRLEVPENIADAFAIPKTSRPVKMSGSATARPAEQRPRLDKEKPVPVTQPVQPVSKVVTPPPAAPAVTESARIPFVEPKPVKPPATIPPAVPPAKETQTPIAAKPVALPQPAASVTKPALTESGLMIGIAEICAGWPESIRQEIEAGQLQSASVSLPMDRLEPALKAGRIAFTWGQLSQWMQPAWTPEPGNHSTEIELPLEKVAPVYMSQRRSSQSRRKVTVNENIPNIFAAGGKPIAAVPPAAAPTPATIPFTPPPPATIPTTAPIAPAAVSAPSTPTMPAPPARVVPPAQIDPDVALLNEVLRQLSKNDWTLQEIVGRASQLKGVAGLFIATPDGFLVASEMPPNVESDVLATMSPHMKGEVLAALFPQLFGKLNEYFKDLEFDPMTNLRFTVGKSTFGVYRAGDLFFAALGHPGEKLPEACLEQMAAALAKRSA